MSPEYVCPEKIELSGSPREIGLAHGKQLADKIRDQIQVYTSMFAHTSKLDWPAVRATAGAYARTIERLAPELYAEMQGIADGAGLDVLDVVALNCRSEIALGLFSDGCTSLGWKTRADGVVLAQNWDWTGSVKRNLVMMSIEREGVPKIWMVTEAGIIGKIGFNLSSVGVCLNAIRAKPADPSKIPIHLALRICLSSSTSAAAIAALEALGGVAASAHILIADSLGPRGLELSPLGNAYLDPDPRGMVFHTNHFLENKFANEPPWLSGSTVRLDRAKELLVGIDEEGKNVDGDLLRRRVFSDEFNAPQSICAKEDETLPKEARMRTLFSIAMHFEEGSDPRGEVVWGRPGSGDEGPVLHMPW